MNEFLEQLAKLLEKHGVDMTPQSDPDGCDQSIQFFRPSVEDPWMDSVDLDDFVSHESIREYLNKGGKECATG